MFRKFLIFTLIFACLIPSSAFAFTPIEGLPDFPEPFEDTEYILYRQSDNNFYYLFCLDASSLSGFSVDANFINGSFNSISFHNNSGSPVAIYQLSNFSPLYHSEWVFDRSYTLDPGFTQSTFIKIVDFCTLPIYKGDDIWRQPDSVPSSPEPIFLDTLLVSVGPTLLPYINNLSSVLIGVIVIALGNILAVYVLKKLWRFV